MASLHSILGATLTSCSVSVCRLEYKNGWILCAVTSGVFFIPRLLGLTADTDLTSVWSFRHNYRFFYVKVDLGSWDVSRPVRCLGVARGVHETNWICIFWEMAS